FFPSRRRHTRSKRDWSSACALPICGDSGEVNDNDSAIFNWPTNGEISSGYGYRDLDGGDKHYGIDIAAPGGTPVYAAASGVVTIAKYSSSYGNVVFIYHPQYDKTTVYDHMSNYSVSHGSNVSDGQQIGEVGNTGHSYGN